MAKIDRKAFRFFLNNAGYVTPPGRVACAAALAKAERKAHDLGIQFVWVADHDADLGDHEYWCDAAKHRQPCSHNAEGCMVMINGSDVASLWGIIDADSNYRRVVEAELAAEVLA